MKRIWGQHTPDSPYAPQLTELPRQLLFIMGCHRSGTSMLYHLLAYTGACEYISAYDIIRYDELLRNRLEGREAEVKAAVDAAIRVEKNRGVDDLPVGADYPEEYRFLLPPRAPAWFVNVRKRVETLSFAPQLTRETLGRFLEVCRKKQFLSSGDRPLVLKNPNDFYFNFANIHGMFPQAKMIFIHRHPLHILNSYIKGFGGIVETRNVYAALIDPRYRSMFRSPIRRMLFQKAFRGGDLPRFVAAALARSYRYYLEHIRTMPEGSFLEIRYDDLCQDPEGHLSRIGEWLKLEMRPRIPEKFVAPRHLEIPERVQSAYAEYAEEMRPYLKSQGFPLWPESAALKERPTAGLAGVAPNLG
jgi:hypothetical protein